MNETPARGPTRTSPLALFCAAALCIAFFGYLRLQRLGKPPHLTWDEDHFVENARNFLLGKPDWNDHPPLGKLLMAGAMSVLGDTPFAWRLVPACAGLLSIALGYAAATALARDRRAGAIAAALLAIDGFLLAYSRTALLDGLLLTCALGCLVVMTRPPTAARALAAGALLGLTASIKFSGVALLVPLALWLLPPGLGALRKLLCLAAAGVAASLVYYAQYAIGQALTGLGTSPLDVARASLKLLRHHAALTSMKHPMTSAWYTWPLPTRPVQLQIELTDSYRLRVMTTLDNPLLWWASWASALVALFAVPILAARRRLHALRELGLPLAGWLGFLLPWVLSERDSYIYHYLPAHGFALIVLALLLAHAYRTRPELAFACLLALALVSVYYAPIWAGLSIAPDALDQRLFLEIWR